MSTVFSAFISLIIAVLSGLGVGSGGLLVIWLTSFLGVSPEAARGMNLLFFVFSASSALLFHLKRKRIRVQMVITLALFALLGTAFGSLAGSFISPALLKKLFGGMLVATGTYTLFSRGSGSQKTLYRKAEERK